MGKNLYKEYLKKQKLKEKYKEEVVVNEQSPVMKALLFLFSILSKIFNILFYLGIIVLCSIGATYIANKLGIINIFQEGKMKILKRILAVCSFCTLLTATNCFAVTLNKTDVTDNKLNCYRTYLV